MVIEKRIGFNFEDIDSVILTLAEEINKGFTVHSIEQLPFTLSTGIHFTEPACEVRLRKKECKKY